MKKTLLVLDAHTNGHEAALRFIRKQGWKRGECELVFCGSHNAIIKRLCQGPAYAVVPVHNSTKGTVTSVTSELARYRALGFSFDVVSTLILKIDHYLMALPHVSSARELDRVMSKDEAMGQCNKFLQSIGITPDKRTGRDSTGSAARQVSLIRGTTTKIGAIAPKGAAKAFG